MTLNLITEEASISEHPRYNDRRKEWGVIPAQEEETCDESGDFIPASPEDRSGWIPEWDGKSMGDLIEQFPDDPRNPFQGITHFICSKIIQTP